VSQEFVREVGRCPIQVAIFKTEIAFSVPYWDDGSAISEALQDASELADTDGWVFYDPQTDTWLE
jgi:hypothetical protein